jgi:perosamine synthetase
MFGIRCDERDKMIIHLKSKGISTGVHYVPLYKHTYFKQWENNCDVAEKIWNNFITLPLHADLTEAEINYVIEALHEADQRI